MLQCTYCWSIVFAVCRFEEYFCREQLWGLTFLMSYDILTLVKTNSIRQDKFVSGMYHLCPRLGAVVQAQLLPLPTDGEDGIRRPWRQTRCLPQFPKPLLMAASMPPFEGACADILSAPSVQHDVERPKGTGGSFCLRGCGCPVDTSCEARSTDRADRREGTSAVLLHSLDFLHC